MMDEMLQAFLRAATDSQQADAEFDLGKAFVQKEVESCKGGDYLYSYIGGMAEATVEELLKRTPEDERLEFASELQCMVLSVLDDIMKSGEKVDG